MRKIKYLIQRIFGMNYKGFFKMVKEVHKKTGKSSLYVFFDIIRCGLKYQAGYVDYNLFEMYKMNDEERKTVITRGRNNEFVKNYNDPAYLKYFVDKVEFHKKFSKYINREWLDLNNSNKREFKAFCAKHEVIFAKPQSGMQGKGIVKINVKDKDLDHLFDELVNNGQTLIEEQAFQCKELTELHPDSINTLRVVTLLGEVVAAFIRVGMNHNNVDNFNHEGVAAPIDIDDGIIKYPAIDKKKNLYTKHPLTNKEFVGLKIPHWDEVKKLCEEAALVVPEVGYIGWDVCVGEDKCFFIEANEYPGHDIYQLPPHRDDNYGLLPRFREVEERKKDTFNQKKAIH